MVPGKTTKSRGARPGSFWHTGPVDEQVQTDLMRYIEQTNARCPRCGYALRGLAEDVCPECGVGFTLEELVKHRYAPRLFVVTGFGFFVSSIVCVVSIVLYPLGFVYFGLCIWWAAAQHRIAAMPLGARRVFLCVAWLPAAAVGAVLVGAVVYSLF